MLTLFLCGDVMTGRGVDQILAYPGDPRLPESYRTDARSCVSLAERKNGPIPRPVQDDYVWGFALQTLADVCPTARIVNLETSVTTSDDFWKGKPVHYRMTPRNIGCLSAAGIDCCALGNNHVLDLGHAGLSETLRTLGDAGIKTAGAGLSETAAWAPAVIPTEAGGRILVFSVGARDSGVFGEWAAAEDRPGVAQLRDYSKRPFDRVAKAIAAARRDDSDIVVMSIHWGGNWGYRPPHRHRKFARRLIDEAGVDIVHGHSSHHVKGIEVYHGRLILYGCGDLITDYEGLPGRQAYRFSLSLMYFPQVDSATGRLSRLRIQPTVLRRLQLHRPAEENVAWLMKVLNREGRRFGTSVRLADDGMIELVWAG